MLRPALSESKRRLFEKLYEDLGQIIHAGLQDADVHEVMLNPDGTLKGIDSVWILTHYRMIRRV